MMVKYLTARKLGINQDTYNGLIWFVKQVKAGKLVHKKNWQDDVENSRKLPFNMEIWGPYDSFAFDPKAKTYCGSVHCIGGWINVYNNKDMPFRDEKRLDNLFYPKGINDWYKLTPKAAGKVAEHFLKTGVIDWTIVKGVKIFATNRK
jgi:hypothetical protein